MTIFSCPNCKYPLLDVDNLVAPVTNLSEIHYSGPAPIPAEPVPAPADPTPDSEPAAPAGEEEELSVNRREYGAVMSRVEEWAGAEPWPGWAPSADLFAGFKGWLRREHEVDSLTITQNRFSGMLRELGSEWKKVGKGRLYSLPPQFRPASMPALVDPEGGPDMPTGPSPAVVEPSPGGEELATPDAGFTIAGPPEGAAVPCPRCGGDGGAWGDGDCPRCNATGDVPAEPVSVTVGGIEFHKRRSDTFPAHWADCALASTMGAAPCDCGATPPHPVVGDEPEVSISDPVVEDAELADNRVVDRPLDDEEILAALAEVPAEGEPGRDAALVALSARRAAAAVDPLAAPLVPAAAAADDDRVEQAAAVSREEFLRGGSGSWLHEDLGRPSTSSPFAPGAVEDYPAIED